MEKLFNTISVIAGIIGGGLSYVFGTFDVLLKVLLILMVLDYLTGIIKGIYNKKLSSDIGWKGLLKKISTLIIVATANVIQLVISNNIGIRDIVIVFYLANEGISILENVAQVSNIVPQKLKDILLQLRDENK